MGNANKIVLSSIALDLKRVAIGYNRGSVKMAKIFLEKAILRKKDVDSSQIAPYLIKILTNVDKLKVKDNYQIAAEDALLYSILLQNAAVS